MPCPSAFAADAVRTRGAEPVRGDLSDPPALVNGLQGAGVCFHVAAKVEDFGPWPAYVEVTAWKLLPLPGAPPLTRFASWVASQECALDDHRARVELGYTPVTTRELRDAV